MSSLVPAQCPSAVRVAKGTAKKEVSKKSHRGFDTLSHADHFFSMEDVPNVRDADVRVLELFAGIGGMRLALSLANWALVESEIQPYYHARWI
eukprot:s11_g17.t1